MRLRTLLVFLASVLASPFVVVALDFGPDETPSWGFVLSMLSIVSVCVFALCAAMSTAASLRGPAEDATTFQAFADPFSHSVLAGATFTGMGVGALVLSILGVVGHWEWLFLLCIGTGCHFGAWAARKFERPRRPK